MPNSLRSPSYRAFIEELIAARKAVSKTQQELADLLDRPQSFIAKFENYERRLDIAEYLNITTLLEADIHTIIDRVRKVR